MTAARMIPALMNLAVGLIVRSLTVPSFPAAPILARRLALSFIHIYLSGGFMVRKSVTVAGVLALSAGAAFADFSYQETSTITGGAIAGMLKVVGVFSKTAREPI